jgi:hypothetical protein
MHVFRHDHVADHHQLITPADLLQHLEKQVAALGRAQKRLPPVTTAGDEVQVAGSVVALEAPRASE